jgi:hypothetical protein
VRQGIQNVRTGKEEENGAKYGKKTVLYTAKKDSGAFLNLFKELGAFNLLRKEP